MGPRSWREAPFSCSRRSAGAVTTRLRTWLRPWSLAERADRLATTKALIASTLPSLVLAAPWARPERAARAASIASAGSDLPVRRRDWRLGPPYLHYFDARGPQVTGEPGPVRARSLYAHPGRQGRNR
jgi:hypothetical protein